MLLRSKNVVRFLNRTARRIKGFDTIFHNHLKLHWKICLAVGHIKDVDTIFHNHLKYHLKISLAVGHTKGVDTIFHNSLKKYVKIILNRYSIQNQLYMDTVRNLTEGSSFPGVVFLRL